LSEHPAAHDLSSSSFHRPLPRACNHPGETRSIRSTDPFPNYFQCCYWILAVSERQCNLVFLGTPPALVFPSATLTFERLLTRPAWLSIKSLSRNDKMIMSILVSHKCFATIFTIFSGNAKNIIYHFLLLDTRARDAKLMGQIYARTTAQRDQLSLCSAVLWDK